MARHRDLFLRLGLTMIPGCAPPAAAPLPAEPPAAASVAPGVAHSPRADRIAVGRAVVGQLQADGLVWSDLQGAPQGRIPLEAGYALAALPDGALLALGRAGGKNVAVRVGPDGAQEQHPVWVVTGERPIAILPEPGVSDAFWILSGDHKEAVLTGLVERYGMLEERARLALDNPNVEDVVALGGQTLAFHHIDTLVQVSAKGTKVGPLRSARGVARLGPGPDPDESVWALDLDGQLRLFRGEFTLAATLPGEGLHLASDANGAVAITAERPPNGEARWTLTAVDNANKVLYQSHQPGAPPSGLALSADRIAAGDGDHLWLWDRATGALLVQR